MNKHNKVSTDIALLIFLAIVVALIIFPILGNMPTSAMEQELLSMSSAGKMPKELGAVFTSGMNPFVASYMHIVGLIRGLLPEADELLVLRMPGAVIVMTMTLCLFRFDGGFDRLNASFLASLLFLSSAIVVLVTFQTAPILIPSALFIFAMMSLYHWLHHRSKRYFWLVVFSSSIATTVIGATAPIAMAIMAYVFIVAVRDYDYSRYVTIAVALMLSCILAFLSIYFLVGDSTVALGIFHIGHQIKSLSLVDENMFYVFAKSIALGVFPWSIPLLISVPWLVRNTGWVVASFKRLDLLQRYGIVIFLFSLPSLMFSTELSKILLLTATFFNMPLIGRYFMVQFSHHQNVWRITGAVCATIVGVGTSAFVAVQSGMSIEILGYVLERSQGWSGWCIFITVSIFIGLYSLWRNVREIGNNNRYLYNIIFLYLLAIVLTFGYIL